MLTGPAVLGPCYKCVRTYTEQGEVTRLTIPTGKSPKRSCYVSTGY